LVEDEWLITARDRDPSHDGSSMWFMIAIGFVVVCETGQATREKWRIPDGKVKSGLFSYSELRRWEPPLVSIKDRVGWALLQQALSCVLAHTGFMGSRKLSSVDGR
jgi:hypothetical protein